MNCKLCKKSPEQTRIFLKNGICTIPCKRVKTSGLKIKQILQSKKSAHMAYLELTHDKE